MTTQMIIRVDPDLKEKISKLARTEGKTTSQVVRELIESYVKERDISSYIDDLWNRVGKKLKSKRITSDSIGRVIKEVRRVRR